MWVEEATVSFGPDGQPVSQSGNGVFVPITDSTGVQIRARHTSGGQPAADGTWSVLVGGALINAVFEDEEHARASVGNLIHVVTLT
jgi:hypothetical protein